MNCRMVVTAAAVVIIGACVKDDISYQPAVLADSVSSRDPIVETAVPTNSISDGNFFSYENIRSSTQRNEFYCTKEQWSVHFPPENDAAVIFGAVELLGTDLANHKNNSLAFSTRLYRLMLDSAKSGNRSKLKSYVFNAINSQAFSELKPANFTLYHGKKVNWLKSYNQYNEPEWKAHLVLFTMSVAFGYLEDTLTKTEREAFTTWGDNLIVKLKTYNDDINRPSDAKRGKGPDRAAGKAMALIGWGYTTKNQKAFDEGVKYFKAVASKILRNGSHKHFATGHDGMELDYLSSTYGQLTVAAAIAEKEGVNLFDYKAFGGATLIDGLSYIFPRILNPNSFNDIPPQKLMQMLKHSRAGSATLGYMELLSNNGRINEIPGAKELLVKGRKIGRRPQSRSRHGFMSVDGPGYQTCWFGKPLK